MAVKYPIVDIALEYILKVAKSDAALDMKAMGLDLLSDFAVGVMSSTDAFEDEAIESLNFTGFEDGLIVKSAISNGFVGGGDDGIVFHSFNVLIRHQPKDSTMSNGSIRWRTRPARCRSQRVLRSPPSDSTLIGCRFLYILQKL